MCIPRVRGISRRQNHPQRGRHQMGSDGRFPQSRVLDIPHEDAAEHVHQRNKGGNTQDGFGEPSLRRHPHENDVLCNKDVLYHAMRGAREEMRMDQSRALRDAAALSDVWSSEIQLTEDKIFSRGVFRELGLGLSTTPR